MELLFLLTQAVHPLSQDIYYCTVMVNKTVRECLTLQLTLDIHNTNVFEYNIFTGYGIVG